MGPLLVVDVQPAYSSGFGRQLPQDVLKTIRTVKQDEPVIILSVNEELSGDTSLDIEEFWRSHGMTRKLFERVTFLEKPYAFFRGWMDNGIADEEITRVAGELRKRRKWDSRDLPEGLLTEIAPSGHRLTDPTHLPWEMEQVPQYQQHAWRICGGGENECLREVELWMESCAVPYERVPGLVY